jgi:hypothetical protein
MTRSFLLALVVLVIGDHELRAGVLAGPTTNAANGHVYFLLTRTNWTAAQAEAIRLGGHLVTISDEAECNWLYRTFSFHGGTPRALWIGFTDQHQEGQFAWVSGETSTFVNWAPGKPNNNDGQGTPGHYAFFSPASDSRAPRWYAVNDWAELDWGEVPKWQVAADLDFGAHGVVEALPDHLTMPRLTIRASESGVEIEWISRPGLKYWVETSDALDSPAWQRIGPEIVGDGRLQRILSRLGQRPQFFRVVLPP